MEPRIEYSDPSVKQRMGLGHSEMIMLLMSCLYIE